MTEAVPYVTAGPFDVHSPEWHAHRRKCIGASEVAAILGVEGAYGTPLKIWADKRGLFEKEEDDENAPEWLHMGQALEPVIASEFERRAGMKVEDEERQFISTLFPFLGCSLDRWTWKDKAKGPLELKNTSGFMKWRWEDGIWLPYQVQVQAQMAVTGAEFAAVAVLVGGNEFKWALAERNQRFIDAMLEKLERFWELVEKDEMPDPVAADTKLIGTLLGKEVEGTVIALSPEWNEVDAELLKVKEEIKELTARKDELEARLKKEIGKAERGVLPGGSQYTFKTVPRQAYTVAASEARQLRRIK
jgi:putative phage-type endonuclease